MSTPADNVTTLVAPTDLELYTRAVEDLTRKLTKTKEARHVLHIHGGGLLSVHNYTVAGLQR